MAYNRIDGFASTYNAYNIPPATDRTQINNNPELEAEKAAEVQEVKEAPKQEMDLTVKEVPERGNATIENVAISFGVYDDTALDLFQGNGLASSDMKKAISGMQKDQILQEYQYFVGNKDNTNNIIADTEDGVVIRLK